MSAPTDPKVREAIIRDYRLDMSMTHNKLGLKYHRSASTIAGCLQRWLGEKERFALEKNKKSYARLYSKKGTHRD